MVSSTGMHATDMIARVTSWLSGVYRTDVVATEDDLLGAGNTSRGGGISVASTPRPVSVHDDVSTCITGITGVSPAWMEPTGADCLRRSQNVSRPRMRYHRLLGNSPGSLVSMPTASNHCWYNSCGSKLRTSVGSPTSSSHQSACATALTPSLA